MPLTFTSRKELVWITNKSKYNGCSPLIRDSALNRFKDMLKACAVVEGLARELILHQTFHSNKHASAHLD